VKLLFINPSIRPDNPRKFYPIGLGYITTAVKQAGYEFDIYDIDALRPSDDQVLAFLRKNRYDVIAFGCLVTHYKWTKWITQEIKKIHKNCKIVVGNSVASAIPEILLMNTGADVAVIGEGDVTIVEVLDRLRNGEPLEGVPGVAYIENGKVVINDRRKAIKNIDRIPFPDRDLFPIDIYLGASKYNVHEPFPRPLEEIKALNVNSARGCMFHCTFCYHVFHRDKYRYRSARSVVDEIKELVNRYGVNYIQLWDELSFCKKSQMLEFAELILKEGLDINWSGAIIAGFLGDDDYELALKLKKSGCVALGFSLESADKNILKSMNKKISLEGFKATRRVLQRARIATNTSLVFGYPEETEETINNTIEFCIEQKISPSAGFVLPQPGTSIYQYCLDKELIVDEEEYLCRFGDRQDLHINLTGMDDNKLRNLVRNGVRRYQEALGVRVQDPMKTLRKRSRDKV